MSFNEKSAWVMFIVLLIPTGLYFSSVYYLSVALGYLIEPSVPKLIMYTIILVVLSIVGQTLIALSSPKDANAGADERDKIIETKAGHWSGYVLGFGAVSGLIHYLAFNQGSMLFYIIFGSLIISQLVEYLMQILLYRRGY